MDKNLGILVKKKKDESLDYSYLLYGSISFLNQFHNSNTEIFLAYMAQYIKSGNFHISQIKDSKTQAEIKSEIANSVIFFEDFIRTSGLDNDVSSSGAGVQKWAYGWLYALLVLNTNHCTVLSN